MSLRGGMRRAISAIAAVGLAVAAIVAVPSVATAAPNTGIVVSDVTITSEDGGQATVGDTLTVSGVWDARDADPHEGDSFTIGLPVELAFPQSVPFQLLGEDGTVWGNCLTDPATGVATCVLTAAVEDRPELVHGTFEFDVRAELVTTEEEVVFDLNGTDTAVDLPGDGGIDDGVTLPDDWDKQGEMNSDAWSMSWTINLPGARLQGQDVVTILEDLSANHVLCDPSQLKIETVRGSTVVDVTEIASVSDDVSEPYDFAFVLTAPSGGFDPGVTYRITYDTCTPDGEIDPQGTEYSNEAYVDVFGESSGVIGVTQDWSFSDVVSKQGSVLGGAERNGTIRWTATVAGDHLVGKTSFTFGDELSGPHEVCADTIENLRVIEHYGPSASRERDVTGELAITTTASSAGGFELDIAIRPGSDFAFQASDYLYLIVYDTCSTTDGLPEAGTAFGNEVSVDGVVDGTDAVVPGRSEGKGGAINTQPVTIDGTEHLPQTTLGWSITVPGERLAGIDSAVTLTDVLSAAHEVCPGTGSVASRLGLRVEARDQIQNGGLATVDLSSTVDAALAIDPESGAQTVTMTIPQPTLPLPSGGEETGFSREYQYVISYTTCTTSGGMDAPGTTYGNSVTGAGLSYDQTVTQNNRGSGSGTGVTRGSIGIVKDLADTPGAAFVPADTSFSVHVKEIDPSGVTQIEYDLEIPLDGDPVSGPNSRGTGWTAELSEPTLPSIPGIVFGTPVFAETEGVTVNADGSVATAQLIPGANVAVSLTNTAQLGALEVVKTVEGPAADLVDPARTFPMIAEIDVTALGPDFPAQPDREFAVTAGEPVVLDALPIGATVTFSETVPADDDVFTWSDAVIDPGSIEVLPEHVAAPATISVTNTVERTVGTFDLRKLVTGDEADNPAVPAEVTVTATWDEEGATGSKTLTLPTDGTPVALDEQLLIGTEVTLTETPLADGSGIAWGAPVWSGTGVQIDGASAIVTVGRDADASVTLENHAATSTAGVSLIKGVAGEAAGDVDPETEFPVTATWTDEDGVEQSRELSINAVTPTPLGEDLPAGTVVTLTEGERPEIATVDWGTIVVSGTGVEDLGDGVATLVVSDQEGDVTLVTVVNEANWAPGTLSLAKRIEGVLLDHPDVVESVTVVASWFDAEGVEQEREILLPVDGTIVELGEALPHATEVTLTEIAPADAASFTWDAPQWSGDAIVGNDDGSATVTIGAATVSAVTVTNTAVATVGELELVKRLSGSGAATVAGDAVFPVTVSWTDLLGDAQQIEVEVGAAAPTTIEGIPVGVQVQLVEGEGDLADSLSWTGVTWSAADDAVTIETVAEESVTVVLGQAQATLTLDNEIDESLDQTPTLPVTGGSVAGLLGAIVGATLLVSGLILLERRRRRIG